MKAEPRQRLPRFAVFIDAENVSPKFADGIFREIAQLGDAPVRLIYGNLSDPNLKGWAEVLPDHSLERRDPAVKGRNSADMAIVIDAMDLLHDGRINGFCLISSDSDFTGLAARLRREGANVYGFGEKKTPDCFRRACNRFISLEGLLPRKPARKPIAVSPSILPNSNALKPPSDAVPILNKAFRGSKARMDGRASVKWGSKYPNCSRISISVPMASASSVALSERRAHSRSTRTTDRYESAVQNDGIQRPQVVKSRI